MSTRLDSIEAQKISADLVAEHVHANVGSMVEYILGQDDRNAPFSWDDLDLRPDPSDWEAERLNAYLVDELDTTWEDVTGEPFEIMEGEEEDDYDLRLEDQSDGVRDYIRDNAEPAEVYEWWIVSGWLANRLEAEGEIVFDGDIWGRQTTGQAIKMDYVIQKIALARHEQLAKYD